MKIHSDDEQAILPQNLWVDVAFPCGVLKDGGCLSEQQGFAIHTLVLLDGILIKSFVVGDKRSSGVRTIEVKDTPYFHLIDVS